MSSPPTAISTRCGGSSADRRPLDVTDADAVSALARNLGRVDILFNCAGFVESGTILDNDESAVAASRSRSMSSPWRG